MHLPKQPVDPLSCCLLHQHVGDHVTILTVNSSTTQSATNIHALRVSIRAICVCFLSCFSLNPFHTETVLLVGYWSPVTDTLLYTQLSMHTINIWANFVCNRVYQLTGYKLSAIESTKGNVKKFDFLMYLNTRRHMAALGFRADVIWRRQC